MCIRDRLTADGDWRRIPRMSSRNVLYPEMSRAGLAHAPLWFWPPQNVNKTIKKQKGRRGELTPEACCAIVSHIGMITNLGRLRQTGGRAVWERNQSEPHYFFFRPPSVCLYYFWGPTVLIRSAPVSYTHLFNVIDGCDLYSKRAGYRAVSVSYTHLAERAGHRLW